MLGCDRLVSAGVGFWFLLGWAWLFGFRLCSAGSLGRALLDSAALGGSRLELAVLGLFACYWY